MELNIKWWIQWWSSSTMKRETITSVLDEFDTLFEKFNISVAELKKELDPILEKKVLWSEDIGSKNMVSWLENKIQSNSLLYRIKGAIEKMNKIRSKINDIKSRIQL